MQVRVECTQACLCSDGKPREAILAQTDVRQQHSIGGQSCTVPTATVCAHACMKLPGKATHVFDTGGSSHSVNMCKAATGTQMNKLTATLQSNCSKAHGPFPVRAQLDGGFRCWQCLWSGRIKGRAGAASWAPVALGAELGTLDGTC
jgi:hypothetical protein